MASRSICSANISNGKVKGMGWFTYGQYGGRKMKIIELPIEFEFNGQKNYIYPSLIILNNELTLVDTGYKKLFEFN